MAKIHCKYHPNTPARWDCHNCDMALCSNCSKTEYLPDAVSVCPVCNTSLDAISASNVIPPFWSRSAQFFLYPLNLGVLGLVAILSIISILLFKSSLIGILQQFILFAIFVKYAFSALNHTADGHFRPPNITVELFIGDLARPLKQLAVFIFMGATTYFIAKNFGSAPAIIYQYTMLLCIPATIMVIAVENSFSKAINPFALLAIVKRIGWPYLVLFVFIVILKQGADIVMSGVSSSTAHSLFLFVYNIFFSYFLLIIFHMIGYVIYQYHEELGYQIEVEFEPQTHKGDVVAPSNPVISESSILIKEGDLEGAIKLLQDASQHSPDDSDILDQLHKLALLNQNDKILLENAQALITALIKQNKTKRAAEVYLETLAKHADFKPSDPDQIFVLAQQLERLAKYKDALAIMNGFAKNNPGHNDIAQLYFMGAKILCERFKQDSKAKAILQDLLKKYPTHTLVNDIRTYLGTIENLAS